MTWRIMNYPGIIFYPKKKLTAFPVGWHLAENNTYKLNDDLYVTTCGNYRDSLPVEFFSHQMMELDISNDNELVSFMSRYGILNHPSRFGLGANFSSFLSFDDLESAKRKTDSAMFTESHANGISYVVVSLDEARAAAYDLQHDIDFMFKYIRGDIDIWNARYINAGAAAQYRISQHERVFPDCSLTNAVCNQVIDFIKDDTRDIRECPRCHRLFKRFQPKETGANNKTNRKPSRSKYCSKTCQDAASQAAKRKRDKMANPARQGDTR